MQKSGKDTVHVQSASLIDLKAELFKKQEEFKAQKLQSQSTGFVKGKASTTNKKPSLFSKKNAGVSVRAEKDYEEKVEEENVFERSRKALENKAKLYEKISSGVTIPEEDGSGLFLVDFQKKVLDDRFEKRERQRMEDEENERREIEEERKLLLEPSPPPASEEDEWVDYLDAFGRSRRCLRKDLPELQKQDETLQQRKRKMDDKKQQGHNDFAALRDKMSTDTPSLLSDDMKREIDRQKWEKEEVEKMEEEKAGPIHYTNVQHNEIRTHGVGYYKFDQEENVRQQQMEQLNQLRQQTKDERSKIEKIKEKRKAALAARLAKAKQRKRARLGLPEPDEDEKTDSDEDIGPKVSEQTKVEPEPLIRDDSWRSEIKSTRDWDKGKQYPMQKTEEAWLEKQRAERENEFAPPSFYYDNVPNKTSNIGKAKKGKFSQDNSDNVKSIVEQQLSDIRHREDTAKDTASPKPATNTLAVNLKILPPSSQTPSYNLNNVSANDVYSSSAYFSQSIDFQANNANALNSQNSYAYPPNVSCIQPNTSVPPPNLLAQPNLNVPPPNVVPNHIIPPPNYHVPPPMVNVPPPVYNAPPPNVNVPPPNFNIPPPHSSTHSSTAQNYDLTKPDSVAETNHSETVRKTFVAKEDVIDTRLMENCD